MLPARISILGLYYDDKTLFDGITLPEGMEKNHLITEILSQTSELPAVYPDSELCKKMITHWSDINQDVWAKLYNTTILEYNPIENYDRVEETKNTKKNTGTVRNSYNTALQRSNTNVVDNLNTAIHASTAFNTDQYQNTDKDTESTSNRTTLTGLDSDSGLNTRTDDTVEKNKMQSRIHGNIGVTTSQQMIAAEREISVFNLYKVITDDFINTFCVGVY